MSTDTSIRVKVTTWRELVKYKGIRQTETGEPYSHDRIIEELVKEKLEQYQTHETCQ